MNDSNHVTTTDHGKLFAALIGDQYDWDGEVYPTHEAEADSIIEAATGAGITVSDESRTALIALIRVERYGAMRNAIIERLDHSRDWLCGGLDESDLQGAAVEWVEAGFSAKDAPAWWAAGAFDAGRAAALRDAGLAAKQCATVAICCHGNEPDTSIVYAVCNNDVSVERAVELVEG